MNADHHSTGDLLDELRTSGSRPKPELLAAIRALGHEAVPALIALVTNPAEYEIAEGDEEDRTGWAPYSALEILGELHPPEALEPLLGLFTWDDYDYLAEALPDVLAQYGQVALDPLTAILADSGRTVWTRWRAATALEKLAGAYPELRDEVVARLTAQLDTDEPDNDDLDTLWGGIVSELIDLQAQESIPSIVRAFEDARMDPYLISWLDVREALDIPSDIAPHLDEAAPRRLNLGSLLPPLKADPAQPAVAPGSRASALVSDEPYRRQTPKIGRNDCCPCGSGKKYKKCHGR